ncbi:hypothetical protein UA08_08544 [Talaromyces atroroseus]|uniref:FAD-binding FR-type domain-containing protein n=1 Tax=Talaromyces atroroseus TaxID=1441469 RepID=A0A1Q5Q863_TALAT|nr:hypothetical protein UA08_08544 [Talaromyces atroroseus]OKL56242.1 hypothetical protein UA08_08544 [Talaromyces atroroseus]
MPASLEGPILPFNDGEIALQISLKVPSTLNPTSLFLTPNGQFMISHAPLLALGALDADGRPWSTVWGGEPGFASVIDTDIVGMRALVDRIYDPVVDALFDQSNVADGSSIRAEGGNKMISGVIIDLEKRKRVKLYGKVILGTLEDPEGNSPEGISKLSGKRGQAQLVVKIEESLGNCPKYLHKTHIVPAVPEPRLISASPRLPPQALKLVNDADCFFISSYHQDTDMDTNYRGGPPGFVRVISADSKGAVLVYPEYSGNRLYQSLGNLMMNHQAGLVFPSFETGDALYMTVMTEILLGADADALLPRCNLAVKMTVVEARYVEKALAFRGVPIDKSPYTPPVRYLRTEKEHTMAGITDRDPSCARLVSKQMLTPSIARFRFKLWNAGGKLPRYKPGQYAVFSFKDQLDKGYSHMRDDDPLSLNDDYIRTFTVSSFPRHNLPDDEFEITIRKNRNVTSYMFQRDPRIEQFEVPMLGFGGTFKIGNDQDSQGIIPFIAGGIGITPVLGQLPGLDVSRLRLFWSISSRDTGLVHDIFRRFPDLPPSTTLFISQSEKNPASSPYSLKLRMSSAIARTGDRAERRRHQNRLNQQAWRQRRKAQKELEELQRHTEISTQAAALLQVPLADFSTLIQLAHNEAQNSPQSTECRLTRLETYELQTLFEAAAYQSYIGNPRADHRLTLVKLNVFRAYVCNITALGYKREGMTDDSISRFNIHGPHAPLEGSIPASLQPTALQQTKAHHPWLDFFPFAQMRDNLVAHEDEMDDSQLCRDLMGFWNMAEHDNFMLVWGDPWDPMNWEITEAFLQKWGWLIIGGV